jgi:hypothetical protein
VSLLVSVGGVPFDYRALADALVAEKYDADLLAVSISI